MNKPVTALHRGAQAVSIRSMALVFLVYWGCGWLGIKYGTMEGSSLTLLWLPSGIGLVACVRYGAGIWPAIWLASFASNAPFLVDQTAQHPILTATLFGAGAATINTGAQSLLTYRLYQRAIPDNDINAPQSILNFLFKVTLLPSAANMGLLTLLYGVGGYIQQTTASGYASVWLAGAMADYLGFFVVGWFGLVWINRVSLQPVSARFDQTWFLLSGAFFAMLAISIGWVHSVVFLLTTLGVVTAIRWGMRAAVNFVLCLSVILTVATANRVGPFVAQANFDALVALLMYTFGLGVPIYLLAANHHELLKSKHHLEDRVTARTQELDAANKRLEALSNSDALTGLANRRHFDAVLATEWQRAARLQQPLAIAMVDVDWFKKYNDHYGHPAGDECLRVVAQTLAATVCRSGDLVARYGGEEFVFLAPATQPEDALRLAQRVCEALRVRAVPHAGSDFGFVTASIGVATVVPAAKVQPGTLIQSADEALYRAKQQGRNQAVAAT